MISLIFDFGLAVLCESLLEWFLRAVFTVFRENKRYAIICSTFILLFASVLLSVISNPFNPRPDLSVTFSVSLLIWLGLSLYLHKLDQIKKLQERQAAESTEVHPDQ